MRRTTIAMLTVSAIIASGCGSSKPFANQPRPAAPVNLTIYINDRRVSISPSSIGAGPVVFIVTNQASKAESLTILPAGSSGSQPVAKTGPINPQATADLKVNFTTSGDYTITAGASGGTEASQATPSPIKAASLHIGAPRPSASNQLFEP